MFSAMVCCRRACRYIYEQFIIWTVFQTAGHMYVKAVIITCQEKFPTAHSLGKIRVSRAGFSNPTRFLYFVRKAAATATATLQTLQKARAPRSSLYLFLVELLLMVRTSGCWYVQSHTGTAWGVVQEPTRQSLITCMLGQFSSHYVPCVESLLCETAGF